MDNFIHSKKLKQINEFVSLRYRWRAIIFQETLSFYSIKRKDTVAKGAQLWLKDKASVNINFDLFSRGGSIEGCGTTWEKTRVHVWQQEISQCFSGSRTGSSCWISIGCCCGTWALGRVAGIRNSGFTAAVRLTLLIRKLLHRLAKALKISLYINFKWISKKIASNND